MNNDILTKDHTANHASPAMNQQKTVYGDKLFFSGEPIDAQTDMRNHSVSFSEHFRPLNLRMLHPRKDISVLISDYTLEKDMRIQYQVGEGAVNIGTILSGRFEEETHSGGGNIIDIQHPCDTLSICDNCEGEFVIKGGAPVRSVSVYVGHDFFQDLVAGYDQDDRIVDLVNKENGNYLLARLEPSPQTQLIATQIIDNHHHGPLGNLYLESKCLELIAITLQRMLRQTGQTAIPLTRSDIGRLHEAKRLLLHNMADPPTIRQLSIQAGLNEFKLKKGFRDLFGKSVFQLLREHRLEIARTMLEDSDMTVSAVAGNIGYVNISHFISAFRNRFGVTPGSLLHRNRRNRLS